MVKHDILIGKGIVGRDFEIERRKLFAKKEQTLQDILNRLQKTAKYRIQIIPTKQRI